MLPLGSIAAGASAKLQAAVPLPQTLGTVGPALQVPVLVV
jgi:hypothetical protein